MRRPHYDVPAVHGVRVPERIVRPGGHQHGRAAQTSLFALVGMFLLVGVASVAHALPGCVDLGGAVVDNECRITSTQSKSGTFEIGTSSVPQNLHFVDGAAPNGRGTVTTGGADVSMIVHGDVLMDSNTFINANKAGCFTGGKITLTVDGDVTTKPLSVIRSNSCSGGEITIKSGRDHSTRIEGLIETVGNISGTGATQPPGGGRITLESLCNLTVAPDGRVSSRGIDGGADLVRLVGGSVVNIFGLVESIGVGHGVPTNPPNHCGGAFRPGKSPKSSACIEIIAGDLLAIDSKLPNNGEVQADTGGGGGSRGTSWIDAYVRGAILIAGDVNEPFSVHANGLAGTSDNGGTITFKSKTSTLTASGLAFQADATKPGGFGGTIVLEAALAVKLDDAQVVARGDFDQSGGFGAGGHIAVQSTGALSWMANVAAPASIGDVRPTGSALPLAKRGTIDLTACGAVTTTPTALVPLPTVFPCPPFPTDWPVMPGYAGVTDTLPVSQCSLACICSTGFSPAAAVTGSILTINGSGLASAAKVALSPSCDPKHVDAVVAPIIYKSGTGCNAGVIHATVPNASNGNYFVIVSSPDGASSCAAGFLKKE